MSSRREAAFPLTKGANGRHLVDQNGRPFLMVGDAAWSLIVGATRHEALRYLDDRAARGFNTVIVDLVERLLAPDAPRNRAGVDPFLVPGDLRQPTEAYFEHADWVIAEAGARGILVLLEPLYLGFRAPGFREFRSAAEGWYDEAMAVGVEANREFGRYLGRRYAESANILWVMAGDRCPGPALPHVRALADGIRETDRPDRLFTAHVHPGCRVLETFSEDSWLTVNATYSYGIVHRALLAEYLVEPPTPNFLFESTYEGMHNASHEQIRRQAYWSVLCGGFGHCIGVHPLFWFGAGWEEHLDTPASRAMEIFGRLFASLPWWDLVPDGDHRLVTAGYGEHHGLDYVAAAATPDGALAVAYLPASRPITVNLLALADRPIRARWLDPVSGSWSNPERYRSHGQWTFRPPWGHDALLILESEAV